MNEFELGGNLYRINKLDAFKQFHLSRKVAPIIPTLIPVFMKLAQAAAQNEAKQGADFNPLSTDIGGLSELMVPFADAIADMSNESAEQVLSICLSAVQRQQEDTWSQVWNSKGRVCMFSDIDIGLMIQLSIRVIKDSLGPFIRGMLSGQSILKG